ncbi:hypothetical protein SSP24_40020 [Streptomyces spinoverrucosus]|uniref:Uncharacterized protein n=1 Tax=Streptomyces spinoverrucosus TaxID=284043 RepID=A0A4Y3VHJ3_9ACTN|nr:hypothetical protein SSP24_40020 [Streptomyces spinoverrucosus]GHB76343.1 hypothetical protein GCM10010397_53590 [Streptomyces spinoverrucosus]
MTSRHRGLDLRIESGTRRSRPHTPVTASRPSPRSPEWWGNFARERHGRDVTEHYQSGLARAEEEAAEPEQVEPETRSVAPHIPLPLTLDKPCSRPARPLDVP